MATTAAEPRSWDLKRSFPGRFLSVTSFKRDGTPVATPVWAGTDGRQLFAFTDLHSAKVRRIRHDPHVLVARCRPDGKLLGGPISAHATVLTAPADLERVQKVLLSQHNLSYRIVMLVYRVGRRLRRQQSVADGAALAITLDSPPRQRP